MRRPGARPVTPGPPDDAAVLLDDAFLRRLEGLRLRARRLSGVAVGGRPGKQRTPAADFIDHRPYSPGDDLRHIDWPASARHDEVFVKVGHRPQATAVDVVVDTSRSMAIPSVKRELAIKLAAALGWLSLVAGDRLSLRAFPGTGETIWGPASGPGAAHAFLGALGRLGTQPGASSLGGAAREAARTGPSGGLAVVISDLWLADDLEVALAGLPSPRWDVLVLHLLGREELDPQIGGAVEIVDPEYGEPLFVNVDDAVRQAYRSAVRQRLERVRRICTHRGATYALIPAEWPLEQAVLPYLRRRAVLGD